jgi:hypothetical protein
MLKARLLVGKWSQSREFDERLHPSADHGKWERMAAQKLCLLVLALTLQCEARSLCLLEM